MFLVGFRSSTSPSLHNFLKFWGGTLKIRRMNFIVNWDYAECNCLYTRNTWNETVRSHRIRGIRYIFNRFALCVFAEWKYAELSFVYWEYAEWDLAYCRIQESTFNPNVLATRKTKLKIFLMIYMELRWFFCRNQLKPNYLILVHL